MGFSTKVISAVIVAFILLAPPGAAAAGSSASAPADFQAVSPPERFTPDTLYEIINGDADLYLKAGFVELEARRFTHIDDPSRWIEMMAYQMEGHRSAFAVYSVRRGEDARPVDLTPMAYRRPGGVFFVHGPYYVEISATDDSDTVMRNMDHLAQSFIRETPAAAAPIPEIGWFPDEGQVADSIVLHPAGAFGFEPFDGLFTARYQSGGGEATVFFRECPSTDAADRLAADYGAFLLEFDGEALSTDIPLPNARMIRILDTYTLIFSRDRIVAGVQDAGSPGDAEALARRLYDQLSARSPS